VGRQLELAQPPGLAFRLQKGQDVALANGSLHVPDDLAVLLSGEITYFALGSGRSKKAAKQDAARNLIEKLSGSPSSGPNQEASSE